MAFNFGNSSIEEIKLLKENLDDTFLFLNAITICIMQIGFACIEMGSVRKKNAASVLMKNTLDMFICAVTYWLVGYSLAFGTGNSFAGTSYWGVDSVPHSKRGHWFFQLSFAAAASTIVSGAVAERCTLVAYAIYTSIISGIIYPLVSHWAWSEDGWLQVLGYRDLAGGGVVHLLGGNCALIGAVVLGSRIGRFEKSPVGQQNHFTISSTASNNNLMPCSLACAANPMPGHSSLLSGFGGLLLAVTFLAFNGASVGQVTGGNGQDASTAAIVAVNTILGGSGAIIAIMANLKAHSYFYPTCKSPEWDIGMIINAALSGMVSICAGADVLQQWTSMLTGFLAGSMYICARFIEINLKIDDPADVVPVHFASGLLGVLTRPLFGYPNGIIYNHSVASAKAFTYNLLGAVVIICWCSVSSFLVFIALKTCKILRVSAEDEIQGLDSHYQAKAADLDDSGCQMPRNEVYIITERL